LNPVLGLNYETPSAKTVTWFAGQLELQGIKVKVRFRKGDKIEAACGQLRRLHR
jgi:23S rRNA (adenine2503-C2)-methyltransferase